MGRIGANQSKLLRVLTLRSNRSAGEVSFPPPPQTSVRERLEAWEGMGGKGFAGIQTENLMWSCHSPPVTSPIPQQPWSRARQIPGVRSGSLPRLSQQEISCHCLSFLRGRLVSLRNFSSGSALLWVLVATLPSCCCPTAVTRVSSLSSARRGEGWLSLFSVAGGWLQLAGPPRVYATDDKRSRMLAT